MLAGNLIVLLLTLSCTLLLGRAEEDHTCRFNSVASLESCRSTFWARTQEQCPNDLPTSGSVTLSQVFQTGSGYVRDRNQKYWDKSRDDTLNDIFYQIIRDQKGWGNFWRHLAGLNLPTIAAGLVTLWVVAIAFVVFPLCCVACCRGKKPRKPCPLFLICATALAASLAGIISIYRATRETTELHNSLADISCLVPQSTYAALFLKLEGTAGTYLGLSEFTRQLDIFELELKDSSDYIAAMSTKSLLKFAVHGIYGPFMWTHKLLSHSVYSDWPNSAATTPVPITLNHTMLGYRALELAGVISSDETKGPYAPVFAAIAAQQEPSWNKAEIANALKTLDTYLKDTKSFITTLLSHISDVVNKHAYDEILKIDDGPILAPLYMISYLPIIGLIGGFGLFVMYMLRHDNEHNTRNAGRGRMALTLLFCFGYATFGIFLMLISALLLAAIRAGHAGCDFVDRGILTEGNFRGLVDLTSQEQSVVDKCLKRGGDGDLVAAFIDLAAADILDSLIGDSWNFTLNQNLVFTKEQLDLQNSDFLGIVLPIVNAARPILTQTSTELFWASTFLETKTVDCNLPGNYYICEALRDLHSGGTGLDPKVYPWASANPLTIHGIQDGSRALTKLVAGTRCSGLTVCIDSDTSCNSNIRIGLSTVGYIPEDLVVNGVSANWPQIIEHASRAQTTRETFSCFSGVSQETQLAWVNGVRWTVLRDLIDRKLTRPATSLHNDQTALIDGYPGYFDACPRTGACHIMAAFTKNVNGTRLEHSLTSPAKALDLAKSELQIAYSHQDVTSVVDLVKQIAVIANPMAKLQTSLNSLASTFNCAIIGDAAKILQDRVCPGFLGSVAQQANMWFAVSVIHLVGFVMTVVYWLRRKTALASDGSSDARRDSQADDSSLLVA